MQSQTANDWKDAGAVDRDGLENRCTLTGTQGSNPCLSAVLRGCELKACSLFLFLFNGFVVLQYFFNFVADNATFVLHITLNKPT